MKIKCDNMCKYVFDGLYKQVLAYKSEILSRL